MSIAREIAVELNKQRVLMSPRAEIPVNWGERIDEAERIISAKLEKRVEARCALCGKSIPDAPRKSWMEHEDGRIFCCSEHLVRAIRNEAEERLRIGKLGAFEEHNAKIRRVILAGTKVTCGECCGHGWTGVGGINGAPYWPEDMPEKDREPCPVCEGSGEVLSEEAEEVLALLEGGE